MGRFLNTTMATLEYVDDILTMRIKEGAELDAVANKAIFEASERLVGDDTYAVVISGMGTYSMTKEGQRSFANHPQPNRTATAVVGKGDVVTKFVSRMHQHTDKTITPTKHFPNESAARKWLIELSSN